VIDAVAVVARADAPDVGRADCSTHQQWAQDVEDDELHAWDRTYPNCNTSYEDRGHDLRNTASALAIEDNRESF
jgi:hypothetical protein